MTGTITALPGTENEHGHYILEVTGPSLTGAQELKLLWERKEVIRDSIRDTLLGSGPFSYDATHRLEEGRIYSLALVHSQLVRGLDKTAFLEYPKQFGYSGEASETPAGLQFRLHEFFSYEQMKLLQLNHVSLVHGQLRDRKGYSRALCSRCYPDEFALNATDGHHQQEYSDAGIFIYLLN